MLLQSGPAFFITNWDGPYYKVGQVLQTGTDVITNWARYYKLGRTLLQSGPGITNWDDYYKVGFNNSDSGGGILVKFMVAGEL